MSCDTFKPLLMGYLDQELAQADVLEVERHLQECDDCSKDLNEFRRLKEVTQNMRLITPDDRYWEQYWSSVYNRIERKVGWILVSAGSILLISSAVYYLLQAFFFQSNIPMVVRIGALAVIVGFCTLLVSVLRERLVLSKSDKYERIRR